MVLVPPLFVPTLTIVVDDEEPVPILMVFATVSLETPILIVFVPLVFGDVPIEYVDVAAFPNVIDVTLESPPIADNFVIDDSVVRAMVPVVFGSVSVMFAAVLFCNAVSKVSRLRITCGVVAWLTVNLVVADGESILSFVSLRLFILPAIEFASILFSSDTADAVP